MDTSNVVMVDIKKEKAWIGSYSDGKLFEGQKYDKIEHVYSFKMA